MAEAPSTMAESKWDKSCGRTRPDTRNQHTRCVKHIGRISGRTVNAVVAQELVPVAAGHLGVLDAQHEQPAMSSICEDETRPFGGKLGVCIWVELLPVRESARGKYGI